MPRESDPRKQRAAEIFITSNGKMTMPELSAALALEFPDLPPLSDGTLRGWKSKNKKAWSIGTERKTERSEKRSNRSERDAPPRNKGPTVEAQIVEAVEENPDLSDSEKMFCALYVHSFNATQSYLKTHNCTYNTARTEGSKLLAKPYIREEIRRLKVIKAESLLMDGSDVVELHMRIAFADIKDYLSFRGVNRPVIKDGKQVFVEHPETKKPVPLGRVENEVKLHDSEMVDGMLLSEVSEGREGVKVKLADRQRSLQFLERYFELNPMDRHRKEYDRLRLEQMKKSGDDDNNMARAWVKAMREGGAHE